MALTSEQGYRIREEYSDVKEKQICEKHNLQQIGGSRTKIDGAFKCINHNLKWDYREYERDNEND